MDELDEILERIPGMEEEEIRRIQNNVNEYYKNHLTPTMVVAELEKHQKQSTTIRLNAEAGSTRMLLSRLGVPMGPGITSIDLSQAVDHKTDST